jgi:NhaP-type Na+/H+ or K+/H+ antiporter
VRFLLESPTYTGATFLLVLPTVLAALWFGVRGGVAVAVAAAIGFFLAERGWGMRRWTPSCGRAWFASRR